MNRRGFLAGVLAAPLVAKLPPPAPPFADVTHLGTASAISGQGLWATVTPERWQRYIDCRARAA